MGLPIKDGKITTAYKKKGKMKSIIFMKSKRKLKQRLSNLMKKLQRYKRKY